MAGTHLTIQDYFRRAGFGNATASRRSPPTGPDDRDNDFRRILEGVRRSAPAANAPPPGGGLRISDYWKHPVTSRAFWPPPSGEAVASDASEPQSVIQPTEISAIVPSDGARAVASPGEARPSPVEASTPQMRIAEGIRSAARKYNLPTGLIRSVIRAESNFQPDAVSRAGAQGLMQLMPATAAELGVQDPFDIEQNIDGGARYLRQMLDLFDGSLPKALAAYNAGPGTVRRFNGNVPYAETRDYVRKVMAYARRSAA